MFLGIQYLYALGRIKMPEFYITFGQVHVHSVNGKTFDKDCVAGIDAKDKNEAHDKAMDIFKGIFHQVLTEPHLEYFPRGIIKVEGR